MICNQLANCIETQKMQTELNYCPNNRANCIEASDCRSNVKCEERKKKYILENTLKNHIVQYRMDGGIIKIDKFVPEGTCKCDYLLVIDGSECNAILTELKGVDIPHALRQLDKTLTQFKNVFSGFEHVYARAIVTSSTPNLKATPIYLNLVKRLKSQYNGNLKISEIQMKEKDIDINK